MNDITKARYYLKHRNSDLQHLESFQLMLVTAEKKYRDIKMRQAGNKDVPGTWDEVEVEAALDYAILRYLKKHNQLPADAPKAFQPGVSLEMKKVIAQRWASS